MRLSLVRLETLRLLRNPILWVVAPASLTVGVARGAAWLPDMTTVTIDAVTISASAGAAVLIVAALAAGRDRRHGMPETLAALPGRAAVRTQAVVLSAPVVGALIASLIICVRLVVAESSGHAAGRIDPFEALGGVALAALAATTGAALGRWIPTLIAAPAVVCAVAFGMLANSRGEYGGWFLPVIPDHDPSWGTRLTREHLLYLTAAAVLLAALALLRHGLRPVRAIAALTALAVAVPAGAAATAGAPALPWATPHFVPRMPAQVCQAQEGVTYCVYPGYQPWIPVWAEAIRPVVAAVPERARNRIPPVRQISGIYAPDDILDQPRTWLVWSTDPTRHRALLIGQMAAAVTGLGDGCDNLGRARTVVALWLAGRAEPLSDAPDPGTWNAPGGGDDLPRGWIHIEVGGGTSFGVPGQLGGKRYGTAEVEYARRLLERPDAAARVKDHWDVLTSPETTIGQALPLLGLPEGSVPRGERCE
ncbi:hypothetical protein Pth03_32050 [Planotetraspora thailandica]|uniref:Uncharacterized protein n=1 Tax=Planotetraspora thailandica TaxID=487172 RepID=A0A8J3XWJ5_9ACTN|nr:hypothetical protein [Planotetraspora thailandica]GII54816.1 hypothetical protein Pth03_32050 [Planotetraspora thailandica]